MKYIMTRVLAIFTLFFITTLSAFAVETYQLDPDHTYVLWHINHLGFSIQTGKFTHVEGTLTVDEANPKNSKVDVTIHMNNLVTGIPKLDEHLQSEDFFNFAKFPTATFVSNKVEVTGKDTGKVSGMLNMLGVSKPVTLKVKLLKKGIQPMTNVQTLGFNAETKFKRSEFGMSKYAPALGDEVEIEIGSEAKLVSK